VFVRSRRKGWPRLTSAQACRCLPLERDDGVTLTE
jgi:hypothetical protein